MKTKNFQEKEIWKEIDGLEGLYEVSSHGRVRNIRTGRILGGGYNQYGYRFVKLKGKTYYVHRLTALVFIPNPDNLPEVDHFDENKRNNDISNLRWVTASENQRHSAHQKSCKIKQLTKDGEFVKEWNSIIQIERETGYNKSAITRTCKGKLPYAYGFQWRYADTSSQRIYNCPVAVYRGEDYIGTFASATKASEALGLKYQSVNKCLKGCIASNKGYAFFYIE